MPVSLSTVSFAYATRPIVSGLDLEIAAGERVALVGPSGSGKSTILGLLGLVLRPTGGQVLWDGREVRAGTREAAAVRRQQVAWIFQSTNVVPYRTAADNVAMPLLARGAARRDAHLVAAEHLAAVGLGGREDSDVREMSGGEVQRVCLARALVAEPQLILADEPTGQLDPDNTAMVVAALRSVGTSAAIAIATHDPRVAATCDRVIHLDAA
jgi:ABC-type lipoprotein export system ATPase subunit